MNKTAVISFHDAAVVFQREIESVMRMIPQPKSFLITPQWHGNDRTDVTFNKLMQGQDNVLHGLTHQSDYFDPGSLVFFNRKISREFLYLDYEATRSKISTAVKLFGEAIGFRPTGFIPPMWYHNSHTIQVLKEMAFAYTETWRTFIHLNVDKKLSSFPLSLDYGNNAIFRQLYAVGWRTYFKFNKPQFIRLAIHPSDVSNGMIRSIQDTVNMLSDDGYTFLTYTELSNQINT